ncbi:MAG: pullulanase [Candidatus Sumerlaeota bacterium]|nr:pullulanase [Candidatus Sumerlaeota bacterium]
MDGAHFRVEISEHGMSSSREIVFHYHRTSRDYTDVGLWIWNACEGQAAIAHELLTDEMDAFGAVFRVDPADWRCSPEAGGRLGFTPRVRQSWDYKDGADRFWTPSDGWEFWIVEGDARLYTKAPDVRPRIRKAFLDGLSRIVLGLSHPLLVDDLAKLKLRIESPDGPCPPVTRIIPYDISSSKTWVIEGRMDEPLGTRPRPLVAHLDGYLPAPIVPREVMLDADLFGTEKPLGALYKKEQTTFRFFSPPARELKVVLYDGPTGPSGREEIALENVGRGVWEAVVQGDLAGRHYMLSVAFADGVFGPEFLDPHATNTTGLDGRARITDLRAADPPGFRPLKRPASVRSIVDAVIYEVHVRDFTISPDSGVSQRGKYLGFVEEGTRFIDDYEIATGLDHLKEMGVTHLQILPVQCFDNDESAPEYNWGYMTAFFNSPEGWYASDVRGDARVRELKQLIRGVHEAGMGVILDTVYNHTGEQNTFEQLCPNYYHRQRPDGTLWNGSGCGTEVRSEAPMVRKFILDSCRFWVEEYGVDGFRFDLMGLMDLETLLEIREELMLIHPGILLYGEPWTGGAASGIHHVTDSGAVRGTGLAAFNDRYRNVLKGEPDGGGAGYVQSGAGRDAVMRGIAGSIDDWTVGPPDTINYATCHDNLCLWDKLAVSSQEDARERVKMHLLTFALLAVSQGVLFLHGGEEMLRTKKGHHNSYNAGDEFNKYLWAWKKKNKREVDFHRGMIAIRRAHPMFRLRTAAEVRRRLKFINDGLPAPETIVFTLDGRSLGGESWAEAVVLVNPHRDSLKFVLPGRGQWHVYVFGADADTQPLTAVSGELDVPGRSIALLAR